VQIAGTKAAPAVPLVKTLTAAISKRIDPETKALSITGSASVASTIGEIIETPRRTGFVSQLLGSPITVQSNAYSYLRQSSRVNAAAPVAIGTTKPESTFG
jgi:hypothetical protein